MRSPRHNHDEQEIERSRVTPLRPDYEIDRAAAGGFGYGTAFDLNRGGTTLRRTGDRRRGRYRGVGPRGYRRSDEQIFTDVCDYLADDDELDASDIEVLVSDSEVTLNGTVDSREDKRTAEDIADWIVGVTHVQNNLRVRPRGE